MRVHRYTGRKPLTVRVAGGGPSVQDLVQHLRQAGHLVSCRRELVNLSESEVRDVARREAAKVQEANAVVMIQDGTLYTHWELGVAIGAFRPVIMLLTDLHVVASPHFYPLTHPLIRKVQIRSPIANRQVGEILSLLEDIRETPTED